MFRVDRARNEIEKLTGNSLHGFFMDVRTRSVAARGFSFCLRSLRA